MSSVETPAPDVSEQNDAYERWLWSRRFEAVYNMRVSVIYHLKRERWFDMLDRWCTLLTALSATAAVGALLKEAEGATLAVALFTAVLSLLPLVVNFAQKARHHAQLAAEFRRLRAEAERVGQRWTEEQCDQFASRVLDIEASEPPPLGALVIQCQNELASALGKPADRNPLRFYERWFKQVWNFDSDDISARQDAARRMAA